MKNLFAIIIILLTFNSIKAQNPISINFENKDNKFVFQNNRYTHNTENPTSSDSIACPISIKQNNLDEFSWEFTINHTATPSTSNNWRIFLNSDYQIGNGVNSQYAKNITLFTPNEKHYIDNYEVSYPISLKIVRKYFGNWEIFAKNSQGEYVLIDNYNENNNQEFILDKFAIQFKSSKTNYGKFYIEDINLTQYKNNDKFAENFGDIVISEVLYQASIALKDGNYVEFYNNTDKDINLNGYSISIKDEKFLLNGQIKSKDYQIFYSSKINSKSSISIKNPNNITLDSLMEFKKVESGYSLERIDLENFCKYEDNFDKSEDARGGTPLMQNSINGYNRDEKAPSIKSLKVLDKNTLELTFDENIEDIAKFFINKKEITNFSIADNVVLMNLENSLEDKEYTILAQNIADACGNIEKEIKSEFSFQSLKATRISIENSKQIIVYFNNNLEQTTAEDIANYQCNNLEISDISMLNKNGGVIITFRDEIKFNQNYTLRISKVTDVFLTTIESQELEFFVSKISKNELLVSEVMFYAKTKDYVEIYNNSNHPINLKGTLLCVYNPEKDSTYKFTIKQDYVLKNQEYLVISEDTTNIKEYYECGNNFYKLSYSLPNIGSIMIRNAENQTIDSVYYSEKFHHFLASESKGYSLERIDLNKPAIDQTNWHTASQSNNYATPGLENSHSSSLEQEYQIKEKIELVNKSFSPNNDGYKDWLEIYAKSGNYDNLITIKIYDQNFVEKKIICENYLFSDDFMIKWDGKDENDEICQTGIYIIFIEIMDNNGKLTKYKEVCVVHK